MSCLACLHRLPRVKRFSFAPKFVARQAPSNQVHLQHETCAAQHRDQPTDKHAVLASFRSPCRFATTITAAPEHFAHSVGLGKTNTARCDCMSTATLLRRRVEHCCVITFWVQGCVESLIRPGRFCPCQKPSAPANRSRHCGVRYLGQGLTR